MSSFESTLARMKDLYTYGKELNESSKAPVYTLEHSAKAADGKTYGIIRECNKYYIKSAPKGKERIAEAYDYLGGICNKKNYEYTSYNSALKNFELKMASINEACDANVNISTLDPFKKGDFIVEGTEKMKNEIARQRQIMYNASMIMNESTEIGADRKDDVVMYDGKNPDAKTGKKGTEGLKDTKANPAYAGSKTKGLNKSVAPFNTNAPKIQEGCECGDACSCEDDWASRGMCKGKDPKSLGWNIDGQTKVNEEESDWASKGLPSSAGIGVANTSKNNAPFNKTINEEDDLMMNEEDDLDFGYNEGDEFGGEEDFEDDEFGGEEDFEGDEFDGEEDFEGDEFDGEEDDFEGDEFDGEEDDFEGDEFDGEEEGFEDDEFDGEEDFEDDEFDGEEEGFEDDEFDGEEDFEDDEFDGEEDDFEDDEFGGEEDFEGDEFDGEEDFEGDEFDGEKGFEGDEFDGEEEDMEFNVELNEMNNSKRRKMNSIVESVVKDILREDELHVFGKHPGYQKKPMDLPTTGADKNQWGEDWNDESVYSEQPFGTQKGSSAPFEKLVDTVTKSVMSKLSEVANKKKVK